MREGRRKTTRGKFFLSPEKVALLDNGTVTGGPYRLYAIGGSALENPTNQTGVLASIEVFFAE